MRYLVMSLAAFVIAACSTEPAAPPRAAAPDSGAAARPRATRADPAQARNTVEEQRRRSEAVRRAAEELTVRGIDTSGYLLNLIAEDDVYRVAFVKRSGNRLRPEITVRMRQSDFEILAVDAPPGAGGDGGPN